MNSFINYLIETNLGLILFLLFYKILLNNETNFNFKRVYLIGGLIVSLLFPLLKVNLIVNDIPSISNAVYLLPEVAIGATQIQATNTSLQLLSTTHIILCVYITVVVLLLIRLILQMIDLYKLTQKIPGYIVEGKYTIIEMNNPFPTFSFFRYIIVGDAAMISSEDKEIIIKHERVHVDKIHSIDVLFVELLNIAFWFNPFIPTYKKLLTNLHEFQADEKTTEQHDVKQYCNLLARVALMSADFKLANHFNNSLTLKRITMMKTSKRKLNRWKVAACAIIVCGFFFVVACQDQVRTETTELSKSSTMALDLPDEVQKEFDELRTSNRDKKYVVMEASTDEDQDKVALFLQQHSSHYVNIVTPKRKSNETARTFMIVELNEQAQQNSEQQPQNSNPSTDEIFTAVQEPAQFKNNMEDFSAFLSKNIKYPEKAIKDKIEGKVYVEFVVEKDGSVTNFEVVKGLDQSCDEEALRVMKLSPKWIPGKQNGVAVRSKFVLPINFKKS